MRLLPLLLPLLLASAGLRAEQCLTDTEDPCKIVIEDTLPTGRSFRLDLTATRLDAENPGSGNRLGYWGENGGYPATYVNRLSLVVAEVEVSIPAKTYLDLGNVNFAEVRENPNAVVLIVKGGEDVSSYYATFVFIDGITRKRTVRSSAHPDKIWEKTTFPKPVYVPAF